MIWVLVCLLLLVPAGAAGAGGGCCTRGGSCRSANGGAAAGACAMTAAAAELQPVARVCIREPACWAWNFSCTLRSMYSQTWPLKRTKPACSNKDFNVAMVPVSCWHMPSSAMKSSCLLSLLLCPRISEAHCTNARFSNVHRGHRSCTTWPRRAWKNTCRTTRRRSASESETSEQCVDIMLPS